MDMNEFQKWVEQFYNKRGWTKYGPFIRTGFLMEEVGEVARVVRSLEIGRDRPDESLKPVEDLKKELTEELGDVLGNILILAGLYEINFEDIINTHATKLAKRFES